MRFSSRISIRNKGHETLFTGRNFYAQHYRLWAFSKLQQSETDKGDDRHKHLDSESSLHGGKKGDAGKTSKCGPPWLEAKLAGNGPRALERTITFEPEPRYGGKKLEVERLWREYFLDPTEWRDHRSWKASTRFPDFVHKTTGKGLWLDSKWIPPWVEAKLAAPPPGSIQLSTFSWNQRLSRCAQAGRYERTMEVFQQMQREGKTIDRYTYFPVLKACTNLGLLEHGRGIHSTMPPDLETDLFIGSSLVDMYAKCGSIKEAERVFNGMPTRNVVAWNAMIRGYAKCGEGQKALELFEQMRRQEGLYPNHVTFLGALNACASVAALENGRRIHTMMPPDLESDLFIGSSLVDMYAKCGSIEEAEKVFKKMPVRDVVAWNAMIRGYVKCGEGQKALEFSEQMQEEGVDPDPVTFVGVLTACASSAVLKRGRCVHEKIIRKGFQSNVVVQNCLIDMYVKCGSMEEAERVFNQMCSRDMVAWTAMILGYVKCGEGQKALELFEQMQVQGVYPDRVTFVGALNACASATALENGRRIHTMMPLGFEADIFIGSSLVDMYAKCGSFKEAEIVFNQMPMRDVVAWNAMIGGYVNCREGQKALELFEQMQRQGVDPNPVTFVGVLNACASTAALERGRRVHEEIIWRGYDSDVIVGNCLVDMYAKCGSVEEAERVFNQMPIRDVVAWSAMVAGYGVHGYARKALKTFREMCNSVEVNAVTFTSLLSACSHGGLVAEGLEYFKSMSAVYNVTPTLDHYSCVVDLLGRAGRLREAEDLIMNMPMNPNVSVWMSLLGVCREHGNVEVGERCAKRVLELDPANAAAHVLLSNLYVASGELDSSAKLSGDIVQRCEANSRAHLDRGKHPGSFIPSR